MADKVQLAKQSTEAFSAGDWERFKAPFSSDAVYEEIATQRRDQGPDAIVKTAKAWKKAFPDAKGTITKVVESGDTVVLEITYEGTHRGDLEGPMGTIPATYKSVKLPAVQVNTFKGDKIVESKEYFDLMTLLAQIGALPAPATA
ncbi:MAG TPA: ester cyclase [Candidatus Limnocylindria bacterium]|jgi:steroid delta-isomerase-like uncharacterized protein|nr:ester cyclase [Candidatus Limnocylindria bacterium]